MQQITQVGALTYNTRDILNQNFALSTILTQGIAYWVKPKTGNDAADGLSPQTALKTVLRAYNLCRSGFNDTILLCAQGNAAGDTTDYQSVVLTWAKNLVHLIGVNDGPQFSQRSRIAMISTFAAASNLIDVTGAACLFANVQFFAGVASALPTGCMKVTGQRNHFANCHIAGMGNAANDIAGAFSLNLSAGAENLLEDCVIGVDTVTLGAAVNSQILCETAATRNKFKNCEIRTYTNHATNNNFLRVGSGGIDRTLVFEDCQFINPIDSASTNLTQAAIIHASAGGSVLLVGAKCGFIGATDWNSTNSGNVRAINGTVTAGTYGLGIAVTQ